MKKNRPVDKLYTQIEEAQKNLDTIRQECKHEKFRLGLYSWRVGSVVPQRICEECDAVVPGITEEEVKQVMDENYDMFHATPLFGEDIK